jgi:flagellar motor switch protein FliM
MDDASDAVAGFDFRKPSAVAPEAEQRLQDWQQSICRFGRIRWQQLYSIPWTWSFGPLEVKRLARLDFPEEIVAYTVYVTPARSLTQLILPRGLAKGIVHASLGLEVTQIPQGLPLTPLEVTALDMMFQAFVEACHETRPKTPELSLEGLDSKPDLQRSFRDIREVVLVPFVVEGPFGSQSFHWIWPEELLTDLFLTAADAQPSEGTMRKLRELAYGLPFDLCLRLGSTQLRLSELSQLSEGDLIVLDQRVNEPLQATIGDAQYFKAWAGRVGNRQGLQIHRLLPANG